MDPPSRIFSDVKHGVPAASTRSEKAKRRVVQVHQSCQYTPALAYHMRAIQHLPVSRLGRVMEISYVHPIKPRVFVAAILAFFVKRIAPNAVISPLLCSSSLG